MRADYEEVEIVAEIFSTTNGKGWIRVNCPLCEDRTGDRDKRLSMGLNTATAGFVCHRCQATGMIPEHLRDLIPFHPEDDGEFDDGMGEKVEEERWIQPAEGFVEIFSDMNAESITLKPARAYLLGTGMQPSGFMARGLNLDVCKAARVGTALSGYLGGRIIVPFLDHDPKDPWLGWVARDYIGEQEPRYRYPKGMRRDRLWNERQLFIETDEPVFVVEGVLDALPFWPNAVAFLGKPTKKHRPILLEAKRPVVIALDGDAWEEGWALAQMLRFLGIHATSVKLPPKLDPATVSKEWLLNLARENLANTPKS